MTARDMEHISPELMRQYADGELTVAERQRITNHLAVCERCRTSQRLETSLSDALRAVPQDVPSPRFDMQVLSELRSAAEHRRSPRRPAWKVAAAGLLIAATLIVVVIAGASGEEQSRSALTPVFEKVTAVFTPVMDAVARQSRQIMPQPGDGDFGVIRIFLIVTVVLLALAGIERFLFPNLRHDHKH